MRGQLPNSSWSACQHSLIDAWKGKVVAVSLEDLTCIASVTTITPVDTGLTLEATVSCPFLGSNMNSYACTHTHTHTPLFRARRVLGHSEKNLSTATHTIGVTVQQQWRAATFSTSNSNLPHRKLSQVCPARLSPQQKFGRTGKSSIWALIRTLVQEVRGSQLSRAERFHSSPSNSQDSLWLHQPMHCLPLNPLTGSVMLCW